MRVARVLLAALGALVAATVVAGAVVAFLAFGLPAIVQATPSPSSAEDVVRSAPAAFRDRTPFRSCGRVTLQQGDAIPAAKIACLLSSPESGRELVVTSPTTEGDPVVRYLRAGPGIDGVEEFEDATADRFGGGWSRHTCVSGRIDQYGACA